MDANLRTRGLVQDQGKFNRFDHNNASALITSNTVKDRVIEQNVTRDTSDGFYHLADHNYIHHSVNNGVNGNEAWANGGNSTHHNLFGCGTVYRNLIVSHLADAELISTKSKGALYIGNTIGQCNAGGKTTIGRHGPQTWMESEWWEDVGSGSQNCGARINSADNVAIGCHVVNCRASLRTGNVTEAQYLDGIPWRVGPYPAATRNLIIGCTVGPGGSFIVGWAGTGSHTVNVEDTDIDASPAVTVDATKANGTVVNGTARIPFTAAVKLTTADVGVAGADPLVPAGQSYIRLYPPSFWIGMWIGEREGNRGTGIGAGCSQRTLRTPLKTPGFLRVPR